MNSIVKGTAIAGLLTVALTNGAGAYDLNNAITNGQTTLQDVTADTNLWVKAVDTKVDVSTAAIANSLSAELKGNTYLENSQVLGAAADVKAATVVEAEWIGGKATINTQAIGNNVTASVADAQFVNAHNTQVTGWQAPRPTDPEAVSNVTIENAAKVDVSALAASNAFALESNAQEINLTSVQLNNSLTTAVSNVSIGYTNALKSSSVAIGNQVSIAPIAIK